MPTIDAHHHFWRYNAEEFSWLNDDLRALRRDFLPADLEREIHATGIDGVVTVQARQKLAETQWLLELAQGHAFIRGVVGWVPLGDADAQIHLERFAVHTKLRAVRHVLQAEADERYMLRPDFNRGIALLKNLGLVYDILIFARHLPWTIEFVDRHPGQIFVLDHLAKPRIRDGVIEPWAKNVCELARRQNVYAKISGLVTEADAKNWTPAQLRPYYDVALAAFGPRRLMFGTDWPVCAAACEYSRWHGVVKHWAQSLSATEQQRIFGGTAIEAYGLK